MADREPMPVSALDPMAKAQTLEELEELFRQQREQNAATGHPIREDQLQEMQEALRKLFCNGVVNGGVVNDTTSIQPTPQDIQERSDRQRASCVLS